MHFLRSILCKNQKFTVGLRHAPSWIFMKLSQVVDTHIEQCMTLLSIKILFTILVAMVTVSFHIWSKYALFQGENIASLMLHSENIINISRHSTCIM